MKNKNNYVSDYISGYYAGWNQEGPAAHPEHDTEQRTTWENGYRDGARGVYGTPNNLYRTTRLYRAN